jgi:hypothetical protein
MTTEQKNMEPMQTLDDASNARSPDVVAGQLPGFYNYWNNICRSSTDEQQSVKRCSESRRASQH